MGLRIGARGVLLPAIDEAASAWRVNEAIRTFAEPADQPVPLYSSGWPKNEDLEYDPHMAPARPKIRAERALIALARHRGPIRIATDRTRAADLARRSDIELATVREFPQSRRKDCFLLPLSPSGSALGARRPVDRSTP